MRSTTMTEWNWECCLVLLQIPIVIFITEFPVGCCCKANDWFVCLSVTAINRRVCFNTFRLFTFAWRFNHFIYIMTALLIISQASQLICVFLWSRSRTNQHLLQWNTQKYSTIRFQIQGYENNTKKMLISINLEKPANLWFEYDVSIMSTFTTISWRTING